MIIKLVSSLLATIMGFFGLGAQAQEAGRVGGGIALAAAGALALGLVANACSPNGGSSSSSK